ncbi:RNA-guided endonuclease InsQ/TnpB family protein [Kitasatospora sp. MAP12-22]|uniref:RNA-guided endonuclease InsQ/TnpB family protein n=1 Tax=unclassified Kitasatospora TaxID=2633591 RepID=UPI002476B638|nr:RNA-guided endonuclease TnpB family protein [Kitasatospora sp. MAP12-44]
MAYKCRAYPTTEQAAVFSRTFGCVRLVWNKTLAERHTRYHGEGKSTSYKDTDAALTGWKKTEDLAFLSEVSSVPLQQTLRHQHTAFANFFAGRAKYPRYKSRNGRQSAHYTRSAFSLREGRLKLAKTATPLELVWSWADADLAELNPTMVVVSREPDGRWYVTFAIDTDDPEPLSATGAEVGIDLGVKDFAVTSDGERIANPKHLQSKAKQLARYQRRMARCERGSMNRRKAKAKIARAYRKAGNARRDFLHRVSTNIVRDHDLIAIEDLNVKGMMASASGTIEKPGRNVAQKRGLNRSVADTGMGEFCSMLEYKAAKWGRTLVVINRWHPSSKTCSHCGHLLKELSLSTRHWTCPTCRTRHDRDVNAAKNILAAGRAAARGNPGDACGGDVNHSGSSLVLSPMKQEHPRREASPRKRRSTQG